MCIVSFASAIWVGHQQIAFSHFRTANTYIHHLQHWFCTLVEKYDKFCYELLLRIYKREIAAA